LKKLVHQLSPHTLPAMASGDINTPNVPAVDFFLIGQPVETGDADKLHAGERAQDEVTQRRARMQTCRALFDGYSSVLLGRLAKGARFLLQGFQAESPESRSIG